VGGEVRDLRQADAAGAAVADLDGAGDEQLSLVTAAAAARRPAGRPWFGR